MDDEIENGRYLINEFPEEVINDAVKKDVRSRIDDAIGGDASTKV